MKYHMDETDPKKYSKIAAELEKEENLNFVLQLDDDYTYDLDVREIKENMQKIRDIYMGEWFECGYESIENFRLRIQRAKICRANKRSIAENLQDEAEYERIEKIDRERIEQIVTENSKIEYAKYEATIKQGKVAWVGVLVIVVWFILMFATSELPILQFLLAIGVIPLTFKLIKMVNNAGK